MAWILLIVSGASTTGLLRVQLSNSAVVTVTYQGHRVAGTVVGLFVLAWLIREGHATLRRWLAAALVVGTVAVGWLWWLGPGAVALHAFVAAFAAAALALVATAPSTP